MDFTVVIELTKDEINFLSVQKWNEYGWIDLDLSDTELMLLDQLMTRGLIIEFVGIDDEVMHKLTEIGLKIYKDLLHIP